MRLTPVSPCSSRDRAWSQELMGALGAQETPLTSVSKSLLSLSDSALLRETLDSGEDTEGFGGVPRRDPLGTPQDLPTVARPAWYLHDGP